MKELKRLGEAECEEILALSQFAFQYELNDEDYEKKIEEYKTQVIWGHMIEGKLAAKLHLFPFHCFIHEKPFAMGGVCSVATWPEYRRQGSVKALLRHALLHMREVGQTISYLHPFSFAFYRKYGWEMAFMNRRYTIPLQQLKRDWQGNGYMQRIEADIPLLNSIYTDYAKKYNGMLARDKNWWEWRILKGRPQIAIAYNESGKPGGYIIYEVKDEIMTVKDMAYTSMNEWKLLYHFISNHDSMAKHVTITVPENDPLPYILDEPNFEQKNTPFFMARIVDVQGFLEKYPFHIVKETMTEPIIIQISDPFMQENEGTYELKENNGKVNVSPLPNVDDNKGIQCSIQSLTAMLLGYKRPLELYELERISGERADIEQLETLIPRRQTHYIDFF